MTQDKVKTLPHSKNDEMMVLGCMIEKENYHQIGVESLTESDFFFTENKIIFRALAELNKSGSPADVHLISEVLKKQGKLNGAGGVNYLTDLVRFIGTGTYFEKYVDIVIDYSKKRNILNASDKFIKDIEKGEKKSSEIVLEFQEEVSRIEKRGIKDKFPIRFLDEFDQNFLIAKPEPKEMILEYVNEKGIPIGFLPKGIIAMLVGAGGIGKTHLFAQLAICVASNTPWLDIFTTTKHCGEGNAGNVFIGLGENQYDDIHRILYKASKRLREHRPDILEKDPVLEASKKIATFSFCGQQAAFVEDKKPSLYFKQFKRKLIEKAPKNGWSLILLDPISRLTGSDVETDNASATQFIALLEELTIELPGNPTILFAHHVTKSAIKGSSNKNESASQADSRGASALTDGARWQSNFYKKENMLIIEMTKSNFTKIIDPIQLEREFDGFLHNKTDITKKEDVQPIKF